MKKFIWFLSFLMMLLSCTVQERYHRRGFSTDWRTISVKKSNYLKNENSVDYNKPSTENLTASVGNNGDNPITNYRHENLENQSALYAKPMENITPEDSIARKIKRNKFNRNLLIASLSAIGIGGLFQYIYYTNSENDPTNYNPTNDRNISNGSYIAGGIGLFAWLVKVGAENTPQTTALPTPIQNEAVITYDSTSSPSNEIITPNSEQTLTRESNARNNADASIYLGVLGILLTFLFGIGIILNIVSLLIANKALTTSTNSDTKRRALIGKRISTVWLSILGTIIGLLIIIAIGVILSF